MIASFAPVSIPWQVLWLKNEMPSQESVVNLKKNYTRWATTGVDTLHPLDTIIVSTSQITWPPVFMLMAPIPLPQIPYAIEVCLKQGNRLCSPVFYNNPQCVPDLSKATTLLRTRVSVNISRMVLLYKVLNIEKVERKGRVG